MATKTGAPAFPVPSLATVQMLREALTVTPANFPPPGDPSFGPLAAQALAAVDEVDAMLAFLSEQAD